MKTPALRRLHEKRCGRKPMKPEETATDEAPAVCLNVLQELIEDGWIGSDEERISVRALLIDFHGHGIISHSTLRRLALSKAVDRLIREKPSLLKVRPSYYGWGRGL